MLPANHVLTFPFWRGRSRGRRWPPSSWRHHSRWTRLRTGSRKFPCGWRWTPRMSSLIWIKYLLLFDLTKFPRGLSYLRNAARILPSWQPPRVEGVHPGSSSTLWRGQGCKKKSSSTYSVLQWFAPKVWESSDFRNAMVQKHELSLGVVVAYLDCLHPAKTNLIGVVNWYPTPFANPTPQTPNSSLWRS